MVFAVRPLKWLLRRTVGLKPHGVVDRAPELLLAAQVSFCGLDRHMSQQELNLVEFATSEMAQPGAGAPEIVRGQLLDAGVLGRRLHYVPDDPRRHAITPHAAGLLIARNARPCVKPKAVVQASRLALTQWGTGTVRTSGFAQQISDDPVLVALLDRLEFQDPHLAAA